MQKIPRRFQLTRARLFALWAFVVFAVLIPVAVIAQETGAAAVQAPEDNEEVTADGNRTAAPKLTQPVGNDAQEALCLLVESAARTNNLPLEFLARVIWQESRFQSQAVGPVTHSGQRALGIAQFMPGTAKERGLLDPFNPVQALPK